jgi:hypothetical protein
MKKNKILRLASVMLMLCLITTCAISGTFAKYTATGTGSDTARVAKWGVTVDVSGVTLFDKAYSDKVVSSESTVKVVAPGTSGTLANISIDGEPEVATTVTIAGTLTLTGFDAYCRIVFSINGATYGTNDTDATNKSANVAALKTAVENAIKGLSGSFAANATLDASALNDKISWAWAGETGADADEKAANNLKDTALGNLAADNDDSNDPKITLSLTVTVDQAI